jgi:Holliday junction DNA helicase RuvA
MIATLEGIVSEKLGDQVVINVSGVGYGVNVTLEEHGKLKVGQETKIYIYEHIRETAHDLYGFCNLETKQLFELLLDVNSVGPKMALAILSLGSGEEVRTAIAGGDTKFIQSANGVGKRVAERVVVELKDKVGLVGVDLSVSGRGTSDNLALKDEAVQGLVALGFTVYDAQSALTNIDAKLPTEERIKLALKEK